MWAELNWTDDNKYYFNIPKIKLCTQSYLLTYSATEFWNFATEKCIHMHKLRVALISWIIMYFNPEFNQQIYGQLIFHGIPRIHNGEKTGSSINGAGKTSYAQAKEWTLLYPIKKKKKQAQNVLKI